MPTADVAPKASNVIAPEDFSFSLFPMLIPVAAVMLRVPAVAVISLVTSPGDRMFTAPALLLMVMVVPAVNELPVGTGRGPALAVRVIPCVPLMLIAVPAVTGVSMSETAPLLPMMLEDVPALTEDGLAAPNDTLLPVKFTMP